jgi:two-component system, NtrC family, response regulator
MPETILVIDDEKDLRNLLTRTLQLEGFEVINAENARQGLKKIMQEDVYVTITDIKLPDLNGIELTKQIKDISPATEVICLTAFGNIPDGVKAIQYGAFDYLTKGDENQKIIPLLNKALEKARLQFKIKHLESKIRQTYGFDSIIGKSSALQKAIQLAQKVAETHTTILLTGDTGTGKEVFANAIHAQSPRKQQAFVAINCSALGKDLLESEMFGHKVGAFTGAVKDKKGLLEEAHKGTLFLDEIGEMPLDLQAKLLRVLENGTFIKVGETQETQVNVRFIAATNRDVEKEIEKGAFRLDLYYRLSVFQIRLPSLHERKDDIPLLAAYFMQDICLKMNRKPKTISKNFIQKLQQHTWKGNVRELRNVIERAIILTDSTQIEEDTLPIEFLLETSPSISKGVFTLADAEKTHIQNILQYTQGNKTQAAKLLAISLTTLYAKIKEYGLS